MTPPKLDPATLRWAANQSARRSRWADQDADATDNFGDRQWQWGVAAEAGRTARLLRDEARRIARRKPR